LNTTEAAIGKGFAAYQQGDLDTARTVLSAVSHPQAWHILGLVERRSGRLDAALEWLEKAAEADGRNPEIPNNQGRVALDAGQGAQAETFFRRALKLRPDWAPAMSGLGRSLNEQKKWQAADPVWRKLLATGATDTGAQYGAAMAALELGRLEEAEAAYTGMLEGGASDAAIYFMRGRARLELSQIETGLADLNTAWAERPEPHVLKNLANSLWMTGDVAGFNRLLASVPEALSIMAVDLLGQSGDLKAALDAWQGLPPTHQADPHAMAIKSVIHRDMGQAGDSLIAAEDAYTRCPDDPFMADAVACARLMVGDGKGALAAIAPWRKAKPDSQHWLAYEATALRVMADPSYDELVRVDEHVRAYELPVPEGFETIASFNDAFIEALEPVRGFTTHPLDQSLRMGAQTSRDLTYSPDPVIKAYIKALDTPIRAYMADIGTSPDHPTTARNTGDYRFNGCWSVKLGSGGRHVNHIHSEGWISSAYYASVPEETRRGDSKAGWIKFGEPPFKTAPETPPQRWIQPEAGLLVLFPSFLWHGTDAISEGVTRVTAPFDVVPA